MKSLFKITLLLFSTLAMIYVSWGQTQPTGTGTDELPSSITVDMEDKLLCPLCDIIVRTKVSMINTNLPTHAFDSMTVELTITDGGKSSIYYLAFMYSDFAAMSGTYGSLRETAYKADKEIDIDMTPFCPQTPGHDLTATARIVTKDSLGRYIDFPICDHRQAGGLYSCEAFEFIDCTGSCVSSDHNSAQTTHPYDCLAIGRSSGLQQAQQETLMVSPNPFNQEIYLDLHAESGIKQLELFNLQGQRVKVWTPNGRISQQNVQLRWETATLEKGAYLLRIVTTEKSQTMKLLKL